MFGACFIAAGPFIGYFLMDTTFSSVIFSHISGFIAGIFSPGKVKDGIKSGFMSGLVGSVIFAVPLVWILIISSLRRSVDFVAGLGILFGLIFAALAVLFASIGTVIGAMIRRREKSK